MKNINYSKNFKVKSLGIQEIYVYDIEVEHNHNFFANNILVHNSCYIGIGDWLEKMGVKEKFNTFNQKDQVEYIRKISLVVNDYVNKKSFDITQKLHYNSQVDDFKIVFEPEKIALTGLFSTKKRYATWTLLNDGKWKDDLSITGLEVIRSDSPELVKPKIINILTMILKKYPDEEIREHISNHKKELYNVSPEEIATNKGINKIEKYINSDFTWNKKCPHQLKGVANFDFLLTTFNLKDKYDVPMEGNKAKVVYLKPNKFNKTSLSFYEWPKEFNKLGIFVDYDKMIYDNYTKKIEGLLKLINKINLLEEHTLLDMFF